MLLTLSKRSSLIAQSEIRAMTPEYARIDGVNLAQGVCDTRGASSWSDWCRGGHRKARINSYTRYDGLKGVRGNPWI